MKQTLSRPLNHPVPPDKTVQNQRIFGYFTRKFVRSGNKIPFSAAMRNAREAPPDSLTAGTGAFWRPQLANRQESWKQAATALLRAPFWSAPDVSRMERATRQSVRDSRSVKQLLVDRAEQGDRSQEFDPRKQGKANIKASPTYRRLLYKILSTMLLRHPNVAASGLTQTLSPPATLHSLHAARDPNADGRRT